MTQDLSHATSFPCKCPGCDSMTGFPFRVGTQAENSEHVRVDLRCRQCKKEWHMTRSLPPARSQATFNANTGAR